MKTIYKYPLATQAEQIIPLPATAKILRVGWQGIGAGICLWAEVDLSHAVAGGRQIHMFGTGFEIPDDLDLEYLGTALVQGGLFVWHFYEEIRP